ALTGLAVSIACCGLAARHYSTYAAEAAQLIPAAEMPETLKAGAKLAANLVARYPKDPRAHLLQALSLAQANRFVAAEGELRRAMALTSSDAMGRLIRNQAQGILAVVVLEQGRRSEAKALAVGPCSAKDQAAIRRMLQQASLCG